MKLDAKRFIARSGQALQDPHLQTALTRAGAGFSALRSLSIAEIDNFESVRSHAEQVKRHSLAHLGFYLERFEQQVIAKGGQVHWAKSAADLNRIVIDIAKKKQAKKIIKGKSMISEETGLNQALIDAQLQVKETDLGEYVIQLADEPPSHIIAPAIHKTKEQISTLFHQHHERGARALDSVKDLVAEARAVMREHFLSADIGITGANVLVAETGSVVLVTNEGNGDLCASLPDVHIVTASIEKVVPTLEDASAILHVLARSATGQSSSAYTSFFTGPKKSTDVDGPSEFHVILLDNGRTDLLTSEFKEMLRCIRCGACMNHCPVYQAVGGHPYGWVYPGPMGAVLTPLLSGNLPDSYDLPNASTFCNRCAQVCPMAIPLPDLMRTLRNQAHQQKLGALHWRIAIGLFMKMTAYPRIYHFLTQVWVRLLRKIAGKNSSIASFGIKTHWTKHRDLPAPQGDTFMTLWKKQSKKRDKTI